MATSRRVGNYAQSANAVIKSSDQIFDAAMSGKPDFTKISQEAIKGRSLERRTAMEAKGRVAKAGIEATSKVKQYGIKADADKEIAEGKKSVKRMAGFVGALGTLGGAAVLAKGAREDKAAAAKRDAADEARTARLEALYGNRSGVEMTPYEEIPEFDRGKLVDVNTDPFEQPGSSTPPAASGATATQTGTQTSSPVVSRQAFGNFDMTKLTDKDYADLAFAIDSEAGPGKDRYGVAASILNRVQSDKFPNTVSEVINQDGQYEGVYKGLSRANPGIAADLSSPEGIAEIQSAFTVLDGRTDFKGQTQLGNRSNKGNKDGIMDPMFDPKGNFFHYSDQ